MATQGQSGSASEGQLEEKIDFAKETDETLKNVESLVSAGALQDALQLLYALEKRCRTGNDNKNLARVCKAAVESCKTAGDHEAMLNTLTTLSTRRNQKLSAITALVETAMPWCVVSETYAPITTQSAEEATIRDKLVANLRTITDGKLFLEREHAILTRALATIKVRFRDLLSIDIDACLLCNHLTFQSSKLDRSKKAVLVQQQKYSRKFMWKPMAPSQKRKKWNLSSNSCG